MFKKLDKKKKILIIVLAVIFFLLFVLPHLIPIKLKDIPSSSTIYDRNNQEIGEIIYDKVHRHQRLDIDQYPDFLKDSIVSIEDRRFYHHNGIDFIALVRAVFQNVKSDSMVQGASTIQSQIARNQLWLNSSRTWWRKIIEFTYGYIIDARYSKKELLSYYLNTLPLGYMNYGFETASRRYFGKSIFQLSKEQQLALLVLAKNAVRYDPFRNPDNFAARYVLLANKLLSGENLTTKDLDIRSLGRKDSSSFQQPYITDFIRKIIPQNQINPQIKTTIDNNISYDIKKIADGTIYKLQRKNVSDYGILVLDKKTNELLVMLGGMFYDGKAGQVNSTLSINQPGSAVKPFTYVLAMSELGLKSDDIIVDEPVQYQSSLGFAYTPQNFSMDYKGPVTVASALSQSLNVPAVKVAQKLGAEKILNFYHKVGLDSLNKSADFYGLALTLGVGEVSLFELTRAYGIFANQGQLCSIVSILNQKTVCDKVIDPEYTDMIVDILSNRYNRMPTFPMYSNLDFPDRNVFLKSGTSRKFSDNRVVGFTDNYIIGVWVGNKDGTNMKGVSGAAGAGDIFNNIVYYLEKTPKTPQYKPQSPVQKISYLNIIKPLPLSVYKIDTTIPQNLQEIQFGYNTNIDHNRHVRILNDKIVDGFWQPKVGSYNLTLKIFSGDIMLGEKDTYFDVQ